MDIIITLPKTNNWEQYLREIADCEDGDNAILYRVPSKPNCDEGDKCFLVYDGFIRGWMRIVEIFEGGFTCDITGKVWPEGIYIVRSGKFHHLKKLIPMQGFRGFKYVKINKKIREGGIMDWTLSKSGLMLPVSIDFGTSPDCCTWSNEKPENELSFEEIQQKIKHIVGDIRPYTPSLKIPDEEKESILEFSRFITKFAFMPSLKPLYIGVQAILDAEPPKFIRIRKKLRANWFSNVRLRRKFRPVKKAR